MNIGKTAAATWTGDSYVSVLTDKDESLSNIVTNGYTLYYAADNPANAWLGGETVPFADGGAVAAV